MPGKVHVKKGDLVLVLSGKDRGAKGKILEVNPENGKVVVEGVNVVKRHQKPKDRYQAGGIVKKAAPVDSSNVMYICSKCDRATRIGKRFMENGDKARFCKKCGEVIEIVNADKE
ncbi:MAG TPA: 50S ribosomal protein L24 [Clostridiales bacterium]|nr:50S ribosomal protein L24 [Clostridiales bacterium]